MKNILLWSVLLLCILQTSKAQTTASSAKADFKLLFEKSYLHTDKSMYMQGDTLWFKAYLVNAQDNKLTATSKTLYVDLIGPDANVLRTELIRLNQGLGNGDLDLPDTIPAGKYRLRAYTSWMRNFNDNFIFEKDFTVLTTEAVPAAGLQTTKKSTANRNNTAGVAPVSALSKAKTFTVRFYPEGGSLVEGFSSLVAVKAEDGFGKGTAASGAVISSSGDTVARFNCDTLGMGLFVLLPAKGQSYRVSANPGNKTPGQMQPPYSFNLPAALSKGLTLQVKQTDSVIHVIIGSNNAAAGAVKPGYTLTVKHAGIALLSKQLQVPEQQVSVKVPASLLPEGISVITLYDENNKPNCERLVYVHHPGENVSIVTDKKNYKPGEQVNVHIHTQEAASLSMAVVDAGIVPDQADNIVSCLVLSSELRGRIEQARRYFDTTNVNRFKQLDLLLMTQGWRDFIWRRLADTAIRISYAAENGINVSGKVTDEINNKSLPGLNVSLYASAIKGTKLYSSHTDTAGNFNFPDLMLYGTQNIKLTSINNKGDGKGSIAVDTLTPLPVRQQLIKPGAAESVTDSVAELAMKKRAGIKNSIVNRVTRLKEVKIKENKAIHLTNGQAYTTFGPSQVFNITAKDEKYKTLEWFMLQNFKGASKSNSPDISGVVFPGLRAGSSTGGGRQRTRFQALPPTLIVDGRQLYMREPTQAEAYRNLYFNLPIAKFKTVELKKVVSGLSDRYLLYLTLKDNAMIDNPGSISIDINGYYEARTFYKPVYNGPPAMADLRTTIHWEPNIKTDAAGNAIVSFFNAQPPTHIKVFIQGLTAKGVPVSSEVDYMVK